MPRKKERIRRKVVVGHELNGKPVVKWATGYTQREVEARKQELIAEYATGYADVQRDMPYREYLQGWYDTYKRDKLSPSARQNCLSAMNNHILPYIGDKQLRAISHQDLQGLLNRLAGRGKTLICDVKSILRGSFERAYAQGIIERNPTVGLEAPKATHEALRALTPEETEAALEVARTHEHGLLLLLLYYTGMRRGEALGLQWGDVDFAARIISVRRDVDFATGGLGEVKTKNALRDIPIPPPLFDALAPRRGLPAVHVIQSPSGSFLPQATYIRWWRKLMIAMLEAAPDIEREILSTRTVKTATGRKAEQPVYGSILTAHYFRHNYATVLYEAGVDVLTAQKVLGHSDPRTTMAIYTHLSKAREEADTERIFAAFRR